MLHERPDTVWQTIQLMDQSEQMSQQLEARIGPIRAAIQTNVAEGLDANEATSAARVAPRHTFITSSRAEGTGADSSEQSGITTPSDPSGPGAPVTDRIYGSIRAQVDEALLEFIRGPARVFAERFNWFPDPEMPLTQFRELATQEDLLLVESELTSYVRARLSRYREALCEWHPARDSIMRSAFAAHERGEYTLSVPVVLTQADGICFDLTGKSLFHRQKELEKTFEVVARFSRLLLQPLAGRLPLTMSAVQRNASFNMLNRHQVIHGEVTTYGTDANSLRAISFLFYVGYVLKNAEAGQQDE